MEQQQLETVSELVPALWPSGVMGEGTWDDPVYVRTPHGTYYFVVADVERVVVEGEQRTVIVVREVEWAGGYRCGLPTSHTPHQWRRDIGGVMRAVQCDGAQ